MPSDTPADARPAREAEEDVKAAEEYSRRFIPDPFWLGMVRERCFLAGIAHERGKSRPAAASEGLGDAEVAKIAARAKANRGYIGRYFTASDRAQACAANSMAVAFGGAIDDIDAALAALSSSRQARRAAEAKVAVAEAWGMKFGLMKSNDRPEPYWLADVREGSDLDKMQQAVTDLIHAEAEATRLRAEVAELHERMSEVVAPEVIGHEWTETLPDGSEIPVMRGSPSLKAFIGKLHQAAADAQAERDAARASLAADQTEGERT